MTAKELLNKTDLTADELLDFGMLMERRLIEEFEEFCASPEALNQDPWSEIPVEKHLELFGAKVTLFQRKIYIGYYCDNRPKDEYNVKIENSEAYYFVGYSQPVREAVRHFLNLYRDWGSEEENQKYEHLRYNQYV
jgi:hypothetical protein